MSLEHIFWTFLSWEFAICAIVWVASLVYLDGYVDRGDDSNIFIFATLNATFILLLMKL